MNSRQSESHWPLTILYGLSSMFNLLLPLILIRILTPDQVGIYKLFFMYAATVPWMLFSSGFSKGIYFWGGHWRNNQEERYNAFSATWSYQICWSVIIIVLTALAFPFLDYFPKFLFTEPIYVALLVASMAMNVPSSMYEEYCVAHGKTKSAGFFGAFWDIFRTIAIIAAALHYQSILAVIIANAVILLLKLLMNVFLTLKHKIATFSLRNNPQARAVWNYAFPSSATAVLAILFGYGDQFILGYYLAPAQFALYSFGCLSIPPLLVFEQSVNKVMIPHFTHAMAENVRTAWKHMRFAIMDLGLWLIPSAIGLFFFAGPITRLLFTDKYPETEYFLKMYSTYYLFFVIPFDAWERAQGRTSWILKATGIFAALSVTSNLIGAKFFNAYVVLGGFLFWQFAIRIYGLYTMKKRLAWKYSETLPLVFLVRCFIVCIALGYATSWLVTQQTELYGHEVIAMLVWGIAFWVIYVVTFVPWSLRKERRERNSKKVLILTQYLNIGGLERMIYNLSNGLRKQGEWEPQVFVYDAIPGVSTMDESFKDIKLHRYNKKTGFSLKTGLSIVKVTRQEGIDQIHAHDLGALIYAVMAKFFSFGRLRVIFTLHSVVHFKKGPKHERYEKIFTLFADKIIPVSEQLQNIYDDIGINKNKTTVIENGVPFPAKTNSLAEKNKLKAQLIPGKENLYWIMCLARLHPGKGQLEALQIWNLLPVEIREKTLLVFVGGETELGYAKIIEAARAQAKTPEHIVLAGSTLEPTPWLQASDLLLSASLQEGLPLAPLEGLALEIPVVLSDIPGHGMFKGFAKLFPVDNFTIGSEIIAALINNPETRQKPEALLNRFSIERMTQDYVKAYTEL
ncbi:hypothetical protein CIK05_05145 [Bdellovibrio sp. qaytius]|nr:hypothetical protein CIK05_05145 [Bdellovibrio sp. qaytius]